MPDIDELGIAGNVDGILNRWPAVGLALGVVRDGALEFFSSHGVANIESPARVTEDTVFRIRSITKTFTAVAVMQLWE
jgi:CubicO group peptidase (beta-lactamase class C family)